MLRIVTRLEDIYGYAHGRYQRVIVEHIKDGRQHFQVMWKPGEPHHWQAGLAGPSPE